MELSTAMMPSEKLPVPPTVAFFSRVMTFAPVSAAAKAAAVPAVPAPITTTSAVMAMALAIATFMERDKVPATARAAAPRVNALLCMVLFLMVFF